MAVLRPTAEPPTPSGQPRIGCHKHASSANSASGPLPRCGHSDEPFRCPFSPRRLGNPAALGIRPPPAAPRTRRSTRAGKIPNPALPSENRPPLAKMAPSPNPFAKFANFLRPFNSHRTSHLPFRAAFSLPPSACLPDTMWLGKGFARAISTRGKGSRTHASGSPLVNSFGFNKALPNSRTHMSGMGSLWKKCASPPAGSTWSRAPSGHRSATGRPCCSLLFCAASRNAKISRVSAFATGGLPVAKNFTISSTSGR